MRKMPLELGDWVQITGHVSKEVDNGRVTHPHYWYPKPVLGMIVGVRLLPEGQIGYDTPEDGGGRYLRHTTSLASYLVAISRRSTVYVVPDQIIGAGDAACTTNAAAKGEPGIFERFRENVKRTGWKEGEGDVISLLNHASRLIPSEAGEVAGVLEKHFDQGHELDRDKLILELGDVMWGIQLAAIALDVTLEEIMERNIEKLKKRYPGKRFTTEDSVARVDASPLQCSAQGLSY